MLLHQFISFVHEPILQSVHSLVLVIHLFLQLRRVILLQVVYSASMLLQLCLQLLLQTSDFSSGLAEGGLDRLQLSIGSTKLGHVFLDICVVLFGEFF